MSESRDLPLEVGVKDGVLSIRMGVACIGKALSYMEENNVYDEKRGGFKRLVRVSDVDELAKDFVRELSREEEDGSTPVTDMLDKVLWTAIENGCFGIEEDGRIDPRTEDSEE